MVESRKRLWASARATPSPTKHRPSPRRGSSAPAVMGIAIAMVGLTAATAVAQARVHGRNEGRRAAGATTIQLWESHNGGPVGGAMTTLVDKFNASHKKVQVSIVVTKASTKLLAAIPAGNAPVLAEISHYDGAFVHGGALVSWNSFMAHSKVVSAKNMLPVVWQNGEVKGQHYRLQTDLKVSEVFYDAALFKKAGIPRVRAPRHRSRRRARRDPQGHRRGPAPSCPTDRHHRAQHRPALLPRDRAERFREPSRRGSARRLAAGGEH